MMEKSIENFIFTFFKGLKLKSRKIVNSAHKVLPEDVGAPINVFSSVA